MLNHIIELQDLNNTMTIGDSWITKNVAWDFTIFTETSELVESLGLKWWKNCAKDIKTNSYQDVLKTTEFDLDNVKVELVDLLHFLISNELVKHIGNHDIVASLFNNEEEDAYVFTNVGEHKLSILKHAIAFSCSMSVPDFIKLVNICGFTLQEIYELYIKKNALNRFRQDNGYKEGTYSKVWDGKEDNTYLHLIGGDLTVDLVYTKLAEIYKEKVIK